MTPGQPAGGAPAYLRNIDLFSDLSDHELAELSNQIGTLNCEPGRLLYAPGEPGEALFLLGKGHVQLYRLSPNGRKLVVARLQAGAFFGGITLLGQEVGQKTHQSYAQAVDECALWRLSHADTQRLLRDKPEIGLRLAAGLARRLRTLEGHLEAMAFQDMPARLARLLLQLAAEQGDSVVQGYTHQDLADVLGAYRETISDTLNKFRADGLVRTGRKQIVLEDWARLEKVAET
jgi:CRP-like cAMP-binding protein